MDLETLKPVSEEKYPFSITALSEAHFPVPLTVGTNLSLHFYDPRTTRRHLQSIGATESLDLFDVASDRRPHNSQNLYEPPLSPYAHLHQPGPLHILHMPDTSNQTSQIYVAGRFSSILNYDRRSFPRLKGTMHSGAQLCSLSYLPYPFASMEKDLARRGELSVEQVEEYKSREGSTLLACGEYRSKGSLEMFGLLPEPGRCQQGQQVPCGGLQNSTMKNRQTSSNSKLLSITNHGTRIVVSDGGGTLKWFERDGFSELRRVDLKGCAQCPSGIFGTERDETGSGDIARKILPSNIASQSEASINRENLVLWTGEKIGMLSFSNKPGFTADSFELFERSAEEAQRLKEEKDYADTMRQALERQANEVRYVRGLGLGFGLGP